MRLAETSIALLALLALLAGTALANDPDPGTSFWDVCLGRSPLNTLADPSAQYTYGGVLNNAAGQPIQGYTDVVLEILSPCQNPVILSIDGPSDVNGNVTWGVATLNQGGGACASAAVVQIRVGGQAFATLDAVHSTDMGGDGLVALSDLSDWQQAFVNQTPEHIGNCDCDAGGNIALSDLSWWQKHFVANP